MVQYTFLFNGVYDIAVEIDSNRIFISIHTLTLNQRQQPLHTGHSVCYYRVSPETVRTAQPEDYTERRPHGTETGTQAR